MKKNDYMKEYKIKKFKLISIHIFFLILSKQLVLTVYKHRDKN